MRSALAGIMRCVVRVVALSALGLFGGAADMQAATAIQFWHAMSGPLGEAVDVLATQFNQSQEAFEVQALYKGTYQEVLAASMAAARHNAAPHIIQVFDVGTQSMILSDRIVPVYRLMRLQRIPVDWADFIETIRNYYAKGDRLYSMPFNTSTPILYYNRDMFRRVGLRDAAPATWPEVAAVSRKILAGGGARCGFTTGGSPSWSLLENTFPWHDQPFATNQNGYTGLDTKLLINSDFGLMHVGALAQWHDERIFAYGGREGQAEHFVDGECAMVLDSSGSIGRFRDSLTFDWGTGQLPHWGPPYPRANTILGGATLWVLRGHEPAAYTGVARFLKFLSGPRQQARWAASTGYVPVTKAAVKVLEDDAFYKKNPERWTGVSQLLNAKPTANSRGLRLGNYVQVREAIELELESILHGTKSVKAGLDAAVARGNAILRQFGVTHGAAAQGEI